MQVIEVTNERLAREFLELPLNFYRNDSNYIRPLDKDVSAVFDEKKNKYFRHGRLKRWLLHDGDDFIGRVAAFINDRLANTFDQPTGSMGFFECIDNQDAANLLFDTCKEWLASEGMEAMDGPVNFGERDRFWGLLIEPFDPPTYLMNYNPPYYKELFEHYGFEVYFKQFTFKREVDAPLDPAYLVKAQRIINNPDYHFEMIDKGNLERYAEYFRDIYNRAWGASFSNFKGMKKEQAHAILKSMKPILIKDLAWFGFYKKEPVCFFIMLPEMNTIFKHVNGQLDLIGKLKFLWYRHVRPIKSVYGVIFGVVPGHRGKGVEGALVESVAQALQGSKTPYKTLEMNWIGDFNPKMISVVEKVGGIKYRTYHTYRYLFDRNKEFKRAPVNE